MKNENRKPVQIALSITAWVLCALSSSFGYSFLSSMPWSSQARLLVGFFLTMAPLSVLWLIIELFRKEKSQAKK